MQGFCCKMPPPTHMFKHFRKWILVKGKESLGREWHWNFKLGPFLVSLLFIPVKCETSSSLVLLPPPAAGSSFLPMMDHSSSTIILGLFNASFQEFGYSNRKGNECNVDCPLLYSEAFYNISTFQCWAWKEITSSFYYWEMRLKTGICVCWTLYRHSQTYIHITIHDLSIYYT